MRTLLLIAALLAVVQGSAQDRDYELTAEIGPLGAEPAAATGGDYSLIAGLRPLPPAPDDRVFTDSFETTSNATLRMP